MPYHHHSLPPTPTPHLPLLTPLPTYLSSTSPLPPIPTFLPLFSLPLTYFFHPSIFPLSLLPHLAYLTSPFSLPSLPTYLPVPINQILPLTQTPSPLYSSCPYLTSPLSPHALRLAPRPQLPNLGGLTPPVLPRVTDWPCSHAHTGIGRRRRSR